MTWVWHWLLDGQAGGNVDNSQTARVAHNSTASTTTTSTPHSCRPMQTLSIKPGQITKTTERRAHAGNIIF